MRLMVTNCQAQVALEARWQQQQGQWQSPRGLKERGVMVLYPL